ncbi:hypothetical protein [Wolbachia endosymbiont of Armadillidium arcangelii]|uniref:Uncharacterized protein n=1 Tax=Wolbachia endosymbiont of Armadillidium arcangelii TaxID=3158571 RepID=A0AAU7Q4M6_9RICK
MQHCQSKSWIPVSSTGMTPPANCNVRAVVCPDTGIQLQMDTPRDCIIKTGFQCQALE